MAGQWRVSVVFDGRPGGKGSYLSRRVAGLLRGRAGGDVVISAEDTHIFGYAATAESAVEVEHVAREVLAQQSLSAEVRFERWDPSGQAWRDARAGLPDRDAAQQPDAHDGDPAQRRLQSAAAALMESVVKAVVDGSLP